MNQDLPRFTTTPYRPEGGFTLLGFVLLLLASLVTGLVLGILAGIVSRWLYLILVFPALIGAGVGGAGYLAIRQGKVRNVVLGTMSGLLGGFFAMLSMHYLGYMEFESGMPQNPQERAFLRALGDMSPEELEKIRDIRPEFVHKFQDPAIRARLQVDDFPSYMHAQAVGGVTISRASSSTDKGMNLGYWGSWIFWIVEVVVVAGLAVAIQSLAARQPFCRRCQTWKESRVLGAIPEEDLPALQEGNLPHFAGPPPPEVKSLILVTANLCPHCQKESPVDLFLARLVSTKEGMTHQAVGQVTYPEEALPYLEKIFQPAPAPEPVVEAKPTPPTGDTNIKA